MSENDPWKKVGTYAADICLDDGDLIDVDVCLRTEVNAARAAEAALNQQALERLTRQAQDISVTLGEAGCRAMPIVDGVRWLVDHNLQLRASLAAVEAERDAERQRWMDARAREIEHSIRADRAEAERDRLKADQQDWRKGVALIASALGDKADDLSCVRIAEIALTLRAALEEAHALLKLFQTCYPAAIASLPENGMERMSAALTLSASPRTEKPNEYRDSTEQDGRHAHL